MNNIEDKRNEIISELYTTGRYQKMYMGVYSDSKQNPIKAYIKQWLLCKGIKTNLTEMIDDFYSELFVHISKIKADTLIELSKNNKKLCATICLIVQRHLMQQRSEQKKHPNVSYFEKTHYNSIITNFDSNELYVAENEEETISDFESKYGWELNEFLDELNENELADFKELANKKGKTNMKNKSYWEKKEEMVYNSINRIKYNKLNGK
ncbi:hypothetical protein [Sphingobacterium mizutaii]|uniref:hypothetical protein n=1 Tax=Sphingobacterium mizutaii TaxID=1010 RepID=UPI001623825E|nr:hypothetical protein [Sphingobacterium mizutaii]